MTERNYTGSKRCKSSASLIRAGGFTMKARIIEQLGEVDVLLPSRIADGLAANDRAKVRMSALQSAAKRAGNPAAPPDDLSAESRVAGIDVGEIRTVVAAARTITPGTIAAPGLTGLIKALFEDTGIMVEAVAAGDAAAGSMAANRLSALKADVPTGQDEIETRRIVAITSLPDGGADSLHRLVMDLHKALNRLAATHAEEKWQAPTTMASSRQTGPSSKPSWRASSARAPSSSTIPGSAPPPPVPARGW
jgi:hypothetical protein